MIVEVPRERIETILATTQETTENFQEQVMAAHALQHARLQDYSYSVNAQIQAKDMQTLIPLNEEVSKFFIGAVRSLNISPRLLHRVQRIARTIADLA